jgi:Protein of unknown function (DUF2815)
MSKFPPEARVAELKTPECRLSYGASLFKARSVNPGGEEKYGCTLIFQKSDMAVLVDAVRSVAAKAWPANGADRLKNGLIKSPILMGDGKEARSRESGEIHPGLGADKVFIRPGANLDRPPVVRSTAGGPNIPATAAEVYSGCYGFAVLSVYPWRHPQSGDGVSFGIMYFQKTRDGDPLGGGGPADPNKWYVPDADGAANGEANPFA